MNAIYTTLGALLFWSIAICTTIYLATEVARASWQSIRIARHIAPDALAARTAAGRSTWFVTVRVCLALLRIELFRSYYDVTRFRDREFHYYPWAENHFFARRAREMQARWDAEDAEDAQAVANLEQIGFPVKNRRQNRSDEIEELMP